jgi:thiol-disulfide isomerase/thioredoxin
MSEVTTYDRRNFISGLAMTLAATQFDIAGFPQAPTSNVLPLPVERAMPSLGGATGWLNSEPLTARSLNGRVALINFWTYTCINWRRTLPYLRSWAERYMDQGLTVIGVHTPEFAFERKDENVRWAAKEMRIKYPIAIDNNYAIWQAFANQAWPALYFIDTKGTIRYRQFGEGDYEHAEAMLQQLLSESGSGPVDHGYSHVVQTGIETAADWANMGSPETYTGYQRTANFASPGGIAHNKPRVYTAPGRLGLNQWALAGNWTVKSQETLLNEPNGRIAYRFRARDLNLVMGPPSKGTFTRFRVSIDGQPPQAAHGVDLDGQGNGTVVEQRMYQLIRQSGPISERHFEIEFLNRGVEAFSFTFG